MSVKTVSLSPALDAGELLSDRRAARNSYHLLSPNSEVYGATPDGR